MRKILILATTALMCLAVASLQAQNRPRSTADFTGGTPLLGVPPPPQLNPDPDSSSGATILPGNMPFGTYTNAAPYVLQISVSAVTQAGGNRNIVTAYVNNERVAALAPDIGAWGSMVFNVPPGATFRVQGTTVFSHTQDPASVIYDSSKGTFTLNLMTPWPAPCSYDNFPCVTPSQFRVVYAESIMQVTALSAGATWAQTGITFNEPIPNSYIRTIGFRSTGTFCYSRHEARFRHNVTGMVQTLTYESAFGAVGGSCFQADPNV